MSSVPIVPKEVAKRVSEAKLKEVLAKFPVARKGASFCYLYGGIRNTVLLVKLPGAEKFVLTIYKPGPEAERRVRQALEIFSFLRPRGFPVPEVVRTRGRKLYSSEEILGAKRFVSLHRYIDGRKIFPYREKQIFEVGKMMSRLHHTLYEFPRTNSVLKSLPLDKALGTGFCTVLHMDLARGNVLFDEVGEKITAVLDFEEAAWGPPVVDVAKSLAIISKDNRELPFETIKEVFISGYNSGPERLSGEDQIDCLVERFSQEIV